MDAEFFGPRRAEIMDRARLRARRLGLGGRAAGEVAERTALRLTWQGTPLSDAAIDANVRREARLSPRRQLWAGAAVGLLLPVVGLGALILSAPSTPPAFRLPPASAAADVAPLPVVMPPPPPAILVAPQPVAMRDPERHEPEHQREPERRRGGPVRLHDDGRGAGGLDRSGLQPPVA